MLGWETSGRTGFSREGAEVVFHLRWTLIVTLFHFQEYYCPALIIWGKVLSSPILFCNIRPLLGLCVWARAPRLSLHPVRRYCTVFFFIKRGWLFEQSYISGVSMLRLLLVRANSTLFSPPQNYLPSPATHTLLRADGAGQGCQDPLESPAGWWCYDGSLRLVSLLVR